MDHQDTLSDSHRRVQRRSSWIMTLTTFGLLALMGRLFYIQVASPHDVQGHDLVTNAIDQRREKFDLDSGRGDILDRNGVSMTGHLLRGLVVLPVWQQDRDPQKLQSLATILHTTIKRLIQALQEKNEPFLLRLPDSSGRLQPVQLTDPQADQITALNITGLYAEPVKMRFDDQTVARHVIGFLGEDPSLVARNWGGKYPATERVGKMGLEYEFQDELRGLGLSHNLSYYTDGAGNGISGLGIRESTDDNHALSVKTTLDLNIQRSVEQAMDHYKMNKGAVVVLSADNEDVLAMASRPNFDPNNPVTAGGQYPVNRALQATFPGSIFKTVIAAAALQEGVVQPNDTFNCPGYIKIGDGILHCWTVHGTVTAEEAFAESCNVAFAQMAMKLGRDKIDEYAKKMGLGATVGLSYDIGSQFFGEEPGSVFLKQGTSPRLIANTGIGQEDVRVTPLQAAHMMAVIADNGEAGAPRLVESLQTEDGLLYKSFKPAAKTRALEPATAAMVKTWARDVVHEEKGTAHVLDQAKMTVAGKTGTAQTGDPNADHQWFAGFAPFDHPKYIIVVMAESVPHGTPRNTENIALQIINALPK